MAPPHAAAPCKCSCSAAKQGVTTAPGPGSSGLSGMALLSNMLLQHSHAWHTSGLSRYAYNVSGIILLSSFPKAVLHRIRAFEGGPGSTGALTTGACSSSVSGTRRAKGKPCMEAEANKKMQTLHNQLKKRHFMTARAQEAVACLVTAEHYKTCCLHHITEPQSDLKCSRTANLSCTPTHPSSLSMESHRPQ